ncbi:NAD-dependent epimerase/dehydratase family protein [Halomonas sp. ISL-60]|uniref:NAD-dependent epimerase/dehydratase family protein n=1 Tax=Halomonas sp. ISL-56 TaxID=2819149 RepID=UPI001BEC29DB|nr:NAD-dependent epimerase/dehydratase family protein [Halomonas sp. ISL-56]MBT2771103.1 NAD-dependent epimerase/dehydratase family protein [Halomonas sp. ISL-60]MBT2799821.1 NAD-dependent epimerase/dehydratase family protein [Halomonas sp. ISL-56]
MSQRRILITGATGGLGMALVREALKRGHAVRATGRSQAAGEALTLLGAQFVRVDLTHSKIDFRELLKDVDSVIHAAALSASWGPQRAFELHNIHMTEQLLEAASRSGVERFVFVSSPSIFAAYRDRLAIGEYDAPALQPLNHYARTKLAAERSVLAQREDAMACCAIRPRALVGPGDRVILPKLAELAGRKRMPLPRGGRALIELTDLRDAAWAICAAEERAVELTGKAINISGGSPITVREVAYKLADALGKTPQLVSLPVGFARAIAVLSENVALLMRASREPMLTRYKLATLAYSQTFDLEPAQRLLGYRPQHDALATLLAEARQLATQEKQP